MSCRLGSSIALALGLAAAALGASPSLIFPTAAQIRTAFTALDANRDSLLNGAEWQRGSDALFQTADQDRNGFIDVAEMPSGNVAQDTFRRIDRDGDGRLSKAEFASLRQALFRAADIDRNDTLEPVEYELLIVLEQVGWTDRNGSERIDLSELRESLTRAFQHLDQDQDGKLSTAEAAYMRPASFTQFDTNADRGLTLEELIAGYRKELGA